MASTVGISKKALLQARLISHAALGKDIGDEQLVKIGLELVVECCLKMAQALPYDKHEVDLRTLRKRLTGAF